MRFWESFPDESIVPFLPRWGCRCRENKVGNSVRLPGLPAGLHVMDGSRPLGDLRPLAEAGSDQDRRLESDRSGRPGIRRASSPAPVGCRNIHVRETALGARPALPASCGRTTRHRDLSIQVDCLAEIGADIYTYGRVRPRSRCSTVSPRRSTDTGQPWAKADREAGRGVPAVWHHPDQGPLPANPRPTGCPVARSLVAVGPRRPPPGEP